MGFYDKNLRFDSNLVKSASGGGTSAALNSMSNAAFNLGDIKQKKETRQKAEMFEQKKQKRADKQLGLNQAKFTLDNKVKNKQLELNKARFDLEKTELSSKQEALAKLYMQKHPKATAGMTTKQAYYYGEAINSIDSDDTPWKFNNSWTASNGHKLAGFSNGKTDKNGNPVYKTIDYGPVKTDWNASNSDNLVYFSDGRKESESAIKQNTNRAMEILKKNPNSKSALEVLKGYGIELNKPAPQLSKIDKKTFNPNLDDIDN